MREIPPPVKEIDASPHVTLGGGGLSFEVDAVHVGQKVCNYYPNEGFVLPRWSILNTLANHIAEAPPYPAYPMARTLYPNPPA